MGNIGGWSTGRSKETIVRVVIVTSPPLLRLIGATYPKSFRGEGGLSEAHWFGVVNALEAGLSRGTETHQRLMNRNVIIMVVSMIATVAGFVAGFLCSFLGGANGNWAVLGVGLTFVAIFVGGIVALLVSAMGLQRLQQEVLRIGISNVDPVQRSLAETYPTVRLEAINITPGGFQLRIFLAAAMTLQPGQQAPPYPGGGGPPFCMLQVPPYDPRKMSSTPGASGGGVPSMPPPHGGPPPPSYYNYPPPPYAVQDVYMAGGEQLPVAQAVAEGTHPSAPPLPDGEEQQTKKL